MKQSLLVLLFLLTVACSVSCHAAAPIHTAASQELTASQPTEITDVTHSSRVYTPPVLPTAWQVNCQEYLYLRELPQISPILETLHPGDPITVLGWEGLYAHISKNGKDGYVLSNFIKPADDPWVLLQVVSPTDTYTYEQMTADMNRLAGLYPESCSVTVIGKSELDKNIPALLIGDPNAKNHVLLHGSIHGREHMTAWLLMAMSDCWLANNLDCMADVCYHIIPMVNPDGVTISQSGNLDEIQTEIYRRDRYRKLTTDQKQTYAAQWKANALGVDLNRNFPTGWKSLAGPVSPSSQRYKGSVPFSAAETQALRDYTLSGDFSVTVSYHAFGSVIYYEYGSKQPVNELSQALALAVQQVTGYTPKGSKDVEGGGYKDWAIDELEIPSLTIEIGCQKAPLQERELYSIFVRNLYVMPAIAQWLTQ